MPVVLLGVLISLASAALVWLVLGSGLRALRDARLQWQAVHRGPARVLGLSGASLLLLFVCRRFVAGTALKLQPLLPRVWLGAVGIALRRSALDNLLSPSEWCLLRAPAIPIIATVVLVLEAGTGWLMAALAALCCLPWLWLRHRVRCREIEVLRELPFHLDMIALGLEAGGTLNGALRASLLRSPPGPLCEALQQLHAELQAGRGRVDALESLRRRVDFESTAPLIAALVQAERAGGSLAGIMRIQAEQRAHERFHRAEKLAMQAPVKMLGPLILCIFPCTFIVLGFVVWSSLGAGG